MDFLALISSLVSQFGVVETAFVTALAGIAQFLPADEKTILFNALTTIKNDLAAGKSAGAALADAWTNFYAAEQGELGKIGQYLLGAILSALAPSA